MTDILHADTAEAYKGGLHLLMFGLAFTFAAYNAGALIVRPSRRLLGNSVIYLAIAGLEAVQTHRHWR